MCIAKLLSIVCEALEKAGLCRQFCDAIDPEAERMAAGVALRDCGELIAAGTENQVDLVRCRQKSLSLSVGFEQPEYLLPFACRPVRHFDRVVEAFVGAVVSVLGPCFDRLNVAAQFVSDDDPWFAELGNQ